MLVIIAFGIAAVRTSRIRVFGPLPHMTQGTAAVGIRGECVELPGIQKAPPSTCGGLTIQCLVAVRTMANGSVLLAPLSPRDM